MYHTTKHKTLQLVWYAQVHDAALADTSFVLEERDIWTFKQHAFDLHFFVANPMHQLLNDFGYFFVNRYHILFPMYQQYVPSLSLITETENNTMVILWNQFAVNTWLFSVTRSTSSYHRRPNLMKICPDFVQCHLRNLSQTKRIGVTWVSLT